MKTLEIFKPGTHTAMSGAVLNFSEADLRAAAEAYDPRLHEAPLVVGHPRADAPAYGWVNDLAYQEGVLAATPQQVDADFAEMVKAGRFKKISASFYLPDSPSNPKPGVYYLRHVGFLGAQPPAVKGLKSASFGEGEEGVVEFGGWVDRVEAGMFRRLREWIIGKFGIEEADKALPGIDVDIVQEEAVRPEPVKTEAANVTAYSESSTVKEGSMKPEEIAAKEAELKQKEADFAERDSKLKERESAARHQEHVSFADELVKAGKLLPALKGVTVSILDFAASQEQGVVEFGEGDGKKSLPVAQAFKDFLSSQPKVVEFGEVAGETGAAGLDTENPEAIAKAALEFQENESKAGRTITITEAVNHVTKGGKDNG